MNYLWPCPTLIGYCETPKNEETNYLTLLDQLPDGQAMILEFENELHLRSGQSIIGDLARRERNYRVRTKALGQWDGKPRLLVWRA